MSDICRNGKHASATVAVRRLLAGPAVAVIVLAGSTGWARASSSHMAIHLRASSGPRILSAGKTVTLRLTVSGVHLDVRDIGKQARDDQGHIQLYLDRIPQSAYAKPSLQHWLASVGATTVSLRLTRGIVGTTGRHRIIAALARNDNVLYRVPPATFKVLIR